MKICGGQIFRADGKSLLVHFVESGTVYFNYIVDGWSMIGGYRMPVDVFASELGRNGAVEVIA